MNDSHPKQRPLEEIDPRLVGGRIVDGSRDNLKQKLRLRIENEGKDYFWTITFGSKLIEKVEEAE